MSWEVTMLFSGEPLASNPNGEFFAMLLRITLFLVFLLVFVFVCGYAWRTLPGLKALIPPPQPQPKEEPGLTLVEQDEIVSVSPLRPRPGSKLDLEVDPLVAAIADGRPGSVVQVASDLGSPAPSSPIVIVRRPETS